MDLVNPLVRRWLEEADEDPDGFWAKAASELHWFRRWDTAFVWEKPSFRWFVGGETNLAYGALDRHVAGGRGGHAALVYANERGDRRVLTYARRFGKAVIESRKPGERRRRRIAARRPGCLSARPRRGRRSGPRTRRRGL